MVAQEDTTIGVEVNGEQLTEKEEIIVQADPAANVTVKTNTPIEFVEIRINGEIWRSYNPDDRSFSRNVTLDLDTDENTVEVIVSADKVSTFTTTITKHTAAPRVQYSSPFTTSIMGAPDNETNVSGGEVTLAGTFHTVSEVERVTIEHTYNISEANETTREFFYIDNPGDSFSQDLLLGTGENEIVARYTDSRGKTNEDAFTLVVDDATDPEINLTIPPVSHSDSVRIQGTIRDNTKLNRVELNRTSNNASDILLLESDTRPDPDRITIDINKQIQLYNNIDSNEFRLVAEDSAGNINKHTFSIKHNSDPQVNITRTTANATTGTLRITGNVSKAEITRVTVETINGSTGDRIDIAREFDVDRPINQVRFDQTLAAGARQTVVNILVTYDDDKQYTETESVFIDEKQTDKTDRGENASEVATDLNNQTNTNTDTTDTMVTDDRVDKEESVSGNKSDSQSDSGGGTTDDESGFLLLGIGGRELFGGIVIVGSSYLLGHWV
ncbi:hypothetical protein [Halorubrum halodurans]|uniref:hypothetical protein n=1 Tax=Halorubrum halodurans TaxID=1383851 RepID=UPI00117BD309|nr:hypothetical protein [Halorubrum halodurans]